MYTQCPGCKTIFEIDEDALQASLGIVRCGHCAQRFDALRTLSNSLPAEPDAALPAQDPESLTPTLTDVISADAIKAAAKPRRKRTPAPPAVPPPATTAPAVDPASEPVADWLTPAAELTRVLLADAAGIPHEDMQSDLEWQAVDQPVQTELDIAPATETLATEDTGGDTAIVGDNTTAPVPAETATDEPLAAEPIDLDAAPVDTDADLPDAAAPPPLYVPPRPRRSHLRDGLWALGCLLLALSLTGQLAWAQRTSLMLDPATQPWMLRACASLDCRLPPIRATARLELLSRDIRPDPRVTGALLITATLRNDAPFTQPWPVIAVTLADLDNNPVAMRRFRPATYMPDPGRRAAGIPSGTTAAVAFEVVDPGQRAVAFHFSFQ
ncbi:MAG: DUF3426 domain-containing protein [Rhodanobacteraceae bacterium]|nr:MAG: DUF3426 domain-containing protein [Rhodanobacteraceae bacterium]